MGWSPRGDGGQCWNGCSDVVEHWVGWKSMEVVWIGMWLSVVAPGGHARMKERDGCAESSPVGSTNFTTIVVYTAIADAKR